MQVMTREQAWSQFARELDSSPLPTLAAAARGENVFPEIAATIGRECVQRSCSMWLPQRGGDVNGNDVGLEEAVRQYVKGGRYTRDFRRQES